MSDYQFTHDWFQQAMAVWPQLLPMIPEGETYACAKYGLRRFLEIGSFEGRSTVWIMENMMREHDTLVCVDTWQGGEEHGAEDMNAVWERFVHNTKVAFDRFPNRYYDHYKGTSAKYLATAISDEEEFHFIYIDGSHIARDVLTDACMAWPVLAKGGIMVFDDYLWGEPRDVLHRPKAAIDAFTNMFAEELDIVHVGYQLVVRKKG